MFFFPLHFFAAIHSLKLTFSHQKMDGWKTFSFLFGDDGKRPIFQQQTCCSFFWGRYIYPSVPNTAQEIAVNITTVSQQKSSLQEEVSGKGGRPSISKARYVEPFPEAGAAEDLGEAAWDGMTS